MVCKGCGCVFCWDLADEMGPRKEYCNATCKRAARRRAKQERARQAQLCICERKKRYATSEAALLAAARLAPVWGVPVYVYNKCGCGWWHLTTKYVKNLTVSQRPGSVLPDGPDESRLSLQGASPTGDAKPQARRKPRPPALTIMSVTCLA